MVRMGRNSKAGGRLILEGGNRLGDGGKNEVAILFSIFGKANPSGGFVPTAAERGGDGVDVHFSFAAKTDAEPAVWHEFEERTYLNTLNGCDLLDDSLGILTFSTSFSIKVRQNSQKGRLFLILYRYSIRYHLTKGKAFVGNGEVALLGDFGGVGPQLNQLGGGVEGVSVGATVAEGAGIGGETGVEAGGVGGRNFPRGLLKKLEEDAGGGGDFGNDEI